MTRGGLNQCAQSKKTICNEDHTPPAALVSQDPSEGAGHQGKQARTGCNEAFIEGVEWTTGEICANGHEGGGYDPSAVSVESSA